MKTGRFRSGYRNHYLPIIVFITVWIVHYVWLGFFLEENPPQEAWVSLDEITKNSWWRHYIETQSYYLGLSYSLSFSFANVAIRKYKKEHSCRTGAMAVGTVSLSTLLATVSCFLIGCCGSPLLGIYLSLFGSTFLPWTKPAVTILTVILIGTFWWLMIKARKTQVSRQTAS